MALFAIPRRWPMVEMGYQNNHSISYNSSSRQCGAAMPLLRTIRCLSTFTSTGSNRQSTEEAVMSEHHDHVHDLQVDAHEDPHASITEKEELMYYEKRVQ